MAAIPKGLPFEVGDVVADLGDERVVAGLLAEYCDYLSGQLASLKDASREHRSREVHRIAHAIRGGALTIGAAELADAAEHLEKVSENSTSALTLVLVSKIEERTAELLRATKGSDEGYVG